MVFVNLAAFRPDDALLNTNFSANIENILCGKNSYMPLCGIEDMGCAPKAGVLAAIAYKDMAGRIWVFAGTSSSLYLWEQDKAQWVEVGEEKVCYKACREAPWNFAVFGNYIVAVNANNSPLLFEVGKSERFRKLGGNPPRAGMVRVWGDFLVLMQLPDFPNRVHWSGLNNIEFWQAGQHSCDYQEFPEGGVVLNSSEDSNPVIFLENATYYGQFLPGSDIIFSFKKLPGGKGIKSAKAIAGRGGNIFYLDKEGFFQLTTDGQIMPIGYGHVNKTFIEKIGQNTEYEVTATLDCFNSRVYWAIDYDGSGKITEILVYDWQLASWMRLKLDLLLIMPVYSFSTTLENLDKICANINEFPYSFDDKRWLGGALSLGGMTADGRLFTFSGRAVEALVESEEFFDNSGAYLRLDYVRPLLDTSEYSIEIGMRNDVTQQVSWSPKYRPSQRTGRVVANVRGRYLRFRLRIKAGVKWHCLRGFDVGFQKSGWR